MKEIRRTVSQSVIAAVLLAGCNLSKSPLEGVVHPIPVYEPSSVIGMEPGDDADDWGDERTRGITWTLTTDDGMEKVVSFYKSELPQARQTEEDGSLTFEYLPDGAVKGELITIEIRPGEIKITEIVPESKRP